MVAVLWSTELNGDVRTDESLIPPGLFAPGEIDQRLPAFIGEIVMLSALLDKDVASMAMSVQDRDQNVYLAQDVSLNIKVCRRRFRYFDQPWQKEVIAQASEFLAEVEQAANERNEIVHRVWSIAVGEVWGGYKGSRASDASLQETERAAGWKYTPARMESIIENLVALAERGRTVVGMTTGLPRLPTPWANGVWPYRLEH